MRSKNVSINERQVVIILSSLHQWHWAGRSATLGGHWDTLAEARKVYISRIANIALLQHFDKTSASWDLSYDVN